jgi:Serpentine type 7TM GPCR receptor class ab chemoreceptor
MWHARSCLHLYTIGISKVLFSNTICVCLPRLLGVHFVRAIHGDSCLTCLDQTLWHDAIQIFIKSFSEKYCWYNNCIDKVHTTTRGKSMEIRQESIELWRCVVSNSTSIIDRTLPMYFAICSDLTWYIYIYIYISSNLRMRDNDLTIGLSRRFQLEQHTEMTTARGKCLQIERWKHSSWILLQLRHVCWVTFFVIRVSKQKRHSLAFTLQNCIKIGTIGGSEIVSRLTWITSTTTFY